MSSDPKTASSDTKKLIPILVILGVLMCGCIAVPVVGGMALVGFFSMRLHGEVDRALDEAQAVDLRLNEMPGEMTMPAIPEMPSDFGGLNAKEAARQRMDLAEQRFLFANAQYEAAQAVYESQRNFNNQQAGRLGAQGVRVPPAQPPDPSLLFEVQAARAEYEAAKAEYESLP
jgi:hypothetical protein